MTVDRIDPATLAVMQNALRQIVNEMDLALEKAAFTPIMSEARDRANGLYDATTGEVISQGDTGMPIFVGVMQFAVQSALADYPDLGPDDVVMLNDPYRGGTHLMDVKLVRPFFYKGERFAVLANCGHWTDIGGAVPGGFGVRATEIYQEGVRIPPVLLDTKRCDAGGSTQASVRQHARAGRAARRSEGADRGYQCRPQPADCAARQIWRRLTCAATCAN